MHVRSRSGQSTVEYMMLISVVVIAIVAAAYAFLDPFEKGVEKLGNDVSNTLATGDIRMDGGGP